MKHLALIFFLFGAIFIAISGYLYFQRINPERLSFEASAISSLPKNRVNPKISPIRISLSNEQIDTPVYEAQIHGTKWDMTDRGASYLTTSPLPGAPGNSIIYGHDFVSIFGRLTLSKPGDPVTVYFNDGSKQNFLIKTTQIVDPSQGEVLKNTPEARLTIYTCTGFLDLKRFIVIAEPISS